MGLFCALASSHLFALDVITYKFQPDVIYNVETSEQSLVSTKQGIEETAQTRQLNSFVLPVPLHALLPKGDFQLVYLYDHVEDSQINKPFSFEYVLQTLFLKIKPESVFNYFFLLQKVTNKKAFKGSDFSSVIYGFNAPKWGDVFGVSLLDFVWRHEYLYGKRKDSFYLKMERPLTESLTLHLMAISYLYLEFRQSGWSFEGGVKGADVFLPNGLIAAGVESFGRGSETMLFSKATRKLKQYFSLSAELGVSSMDFDFFTMDNKTIARVESGFSKYLQLGLQLDL